MAARLAADGVVDGPEAFPGPDGAGMKIELDRAVINRLGVLYSDIDAAIGLARGGAPDVSFARGRSAKVRLEGKDLAERVSGLFVRTGKGDAVPLKAMVKLTAATEPLAVYRWGAFPAVRITANPPPGGRSQPPPPGVWPSRPPNARD